MYSHMQDCAATLRCFLSLKIRITSFIFELIMRPYLIGLRPYRDRVAVGNFNSDFSRSPFGTARHGRSLYVRTNTTVCLEVCERLGVARRVAAFPKYAYCQPVQVYEDTQRQNLTSKYIFKNIFI